LHFRCVDRNNNHTLLVPNAIHVPSIPQQSALAAGVVPTPLPSYLQQAPVPPVRVIGTVAQGLLEKRAAQAVNANLLAEAAPDFAQASLATAIEKINLNGRTGSLAIQLISPVVAGEILHQLQEYNAGQKAKNLWFKPLLPTTRYTLDVVAGPLESDRDSKSLQGSAPQVSLNTITEATDAIGLLAALQAYFAYEDSLTTLERVQFATSRYETFTAHMANVTNQLTSGPGATPVRNYVAAVDPFAWLSSATPLIDAFATAGATYLADHGKLASLVASFNPLADDLQPGIAPAANGAAALVAQRQTVATDWATFSQAINALYDGLITALGHPEMASNTAPIAVPDTEISLFTHPEPRAVAVAADMALDPAHRFGERGRSLTCFVERRRDDWTACTPQAGAGNVQLQHHLPGKHWGRGALHNVGRLWRRGNRAGRAHQAGADNLPSDRNSDRDSGPRRPEPTHKTKCDPQGVRRRRGSLAR
jgi:hypothetical protein